MMLVGVEGDGRDGSDGGDGGGTSSEQEWRVVRFDEASPSAHIVVREVKVKEVKEEGMLDEEERAGKDKDKGKGQRQGEGEDAAAVEAAAASSNGPQESPAETEAPPEHSETKAQPEVPVHELVLREYRPVSDQRGWIRLRVYDLDDSSDGGSGGSGGGGGGGSGSKRTSWRCGTMSGIRLPSGEVRCSNYVAQQVAARAEEFIGFMIEAAELCAEQAEKIAAAEKEVTALEAIVERSEDEEKKLGERQAEAAEARKKVNECLVEKEQQPIVTDKVIVCHWDNEKIREKPKEKPAVRFEGAEEEATDDDTSDASTTVSVDRIELAPSVRYAERQQILLFHEQAWHLGSALGNTGVGSKCRVRIGVGDSTQEQVVEVDLNDANHAPAFFVSMEVADQAKQRYGIKLTEEHGHIYDIFSGQQLSTRTQTATLQFREKERKDQMLTGKTQDLDNLDYQRARKKSQYEKTEEEQKGVLVTEILKLMLQPSNRRSSGHWVVKHNRMLILGPAASGKTTLLKTFIVEILYSYKDFVPILMPVIELVRVFEKQQPGTSVLVTYLQLHYADHCHLLMQKVLQRQAVFLIDGIDESGTSRDQVQDFVTSELLQAGHKTIITSRHSGFAGDAFQHCKVVELLPLTPAQQAGMVKSRVDDEERADELIEQLADPVFEEIVTNPLMLTMVISIYVSNDYKLISNRAELYEQALQTIVGRTDKVRSGLERSKHKKIFGWLQQIAFNSHLRKGERRIFNKAQAMEWAGDGFGTVGAYIQEGELPIVTSMGLNSKDEEEYRFSHLTYQEYLTARELVEQARKSRFDIGTITSILGSPPTAAFADVRWQVLLQLAADCFVVTEASSGEAGDTGISRFARSLFSGLTAEAKEKAQASVMVSGASGALMICRSDEPPAGGELSLGAGVGAPGAKALAPFLRASQGMRSVCLKGAQMGAQGCADIVDALVGSAAGSLKELDLSGEAVTDTLMEQVTRCTRLTRLAVAGCVELTDEGLQNMSRCSALVDVDVSGCLMLTDHGMGHLSRCTLLTAMNVKGCELVSVFSLAALCKACAGMRPFTGLNVNDRIHDDLLLAYTTVSAELTEMNLANSC
eukprot:g2706.t1